MPVSCGHRRGPKTVLAQTAEITKCHVIFIVFFKFWIEIAGGGINHFFFENPIWCMICLCSYSDQKGNQSFYWREAMAVNSDCWPLILHLHYPWGQPIMPIQVFDIAIIHRGLRYDFLFFLQPTYFFNFFYFYSTFLFLIFLPFIFSPFSILFQFFFNSFHFMQWCQNQGWPPIFGRSVNPIPTGGGQIIPTYYY